MPDPVTPAVSSAVIATRTPAEVDAVLRLPAVADAAIARATPAQIQAAIPRVPWWRSKGMVLAYVGIGTAVLDATVSLAESKDLSWRTVVIGIGSVIAAWARKNASTIVSSYVGGDVG